jgi:phasin family protein
MSFTTVATQLIEFQKSNLVSSNSLRESLFGAAARSFDLNTAAYRTVLQRGAEVSRNLSGSMDAQDVFAICVGHMAPALEEFAGYSRDACGIATDTGIEVLQLAEAHVARINRHMTEFAEIADPDSPFGSSSAAWMIRAIASSTQSGLEAGLRSAQQAASCIDAYFGTLYPGAAPVAQEAGA